jgi:hypothetical protein
MLLAASAALVAVAATATVSALVSTALVTALISATVVTLIAAPLVSTIILGTSFTAFTADFRHVLAVLADGFSTLLGDLALLVVIHRCESAFFFVCHSFSPLYGKAPC